MKPVLIVHTCIYYFTDAFKKCKEVNPCSKKLTFKKWIGTCWTKVGGNSDCICFTVISALSVGLSENTPVKVTRRGMSEKVLKVCLSTRCSEQRPAKISPMQAQNLSDSRGAPCTEIGLLKDRSISPWATWTETMFASRAESLLQGWKRSPVLTALNLSCQLCLAYLQLTYFCVNTSLSQITMFS